MCKERRGILPIDNKRRPLVYLAHRRNRFPPPHCPRRCTAHRRATRRRTARRRTACRLTARRETAGRTACASTVVAAVVAALSGRRGGVVGAAAAQHDRHHHLQVVHDLLVPVASRHGCGDLHQMAHAQVQRPRARGEHYRSVG